MKRHWAHLLYVLRRKRLYVTYGRTLGVSWWDVLVHDTYFFRPGLWALGATVFHGPEAEEWVHRRAKEILAYFDHGKPQGEAEEVEALRMAKHQHAVYARQMQELHDRFALVAQRKPWRWEAYIVRDLALTRYVEMPERWVRAMVADWCTGARMSGAEPDKVYAQVRKWYVVNREAVRLSPSTKNLVRQLLEGLK